MVMSEIVSPKYAKVIARIQSGTMSRTELSKLKRNAEEKLKQGDADAQQVLAAMDTAVPDDAYILFMGFCPDAAFSGRLDIEWKEKGICRFDWPESAHQQERFESICKGDLVVLKKREKFGKTMKLYGHGRVTALATDENNVRFLQMEWSAQNSEIEVPLLGCNSTVDIRTMDVVEAEMPAEFFQWLKN
jgi:hypothetical protein